ncbi:MAG: hypothetical protein HOV81_44010 [Kofleriaceae bacterium]|nr:hypothetical protein [Kofleriaceae bacterium]
MRYALMSDIEVDGGRRRCAPRPTNASAVTRDLARRTVDPESESVAKGREGTDEGNGTIRC